MRATHDTGIVPCRDCGADVLVHLDVRPLGFREDGRLAADVRVRADRHECTPAADEPEASA